MSSFMFSSVETCGSFNFFFFLSKTSGNPLALEEVGVTDQAEKKKEACEGLAANLNDHSALCSCCNAEEHNIALIIG